MRPVITSLSDTSLLLQLGKQITPALNRRIHALNALLAAHPLQGISETVPAYASLAVHYNPLQTSPGQVKTWLLQHLETANDLASPAPAEYHIPVQYSGPDLAFVAEHCKQSILEIIRLHSRQPYTVYMMGFSPGFPYLGLLPKALQVPRRASPRTHVPAGAVAIAGRQTGIYPTASPGGWQIIGQTSLPLLDATQDPPFLLAPGDTVRFVQDD